MDKLEETLAAVASGDLSPTSAARRLKGGEVRYLDEFAVLDSAAPTARASPRSSTPAPRAPTR
jgi:hypothetical protein